MSLIIINGHVIGQSRMPFTRHKWECSYCELVAEVLDEFIEIDCDTRHMVQSEVEE